MIKKNLFILVLLYATIGLAQQGSKSPYSFFGIGDLRFRGTNENRIMGGIAMMADSIHLNLQNPAAYSKLRLTTYALGVTYNSIQFETEDANANTDNATLDYLSMAFPVSKKMGLGFGFMPFSSVGFELQNTDTIAGSVSQFEGTGGVEGNYNFGDIENQNTIAFDNVQFGSRESNRSDLYGFSYTLGVHHQIKTKKGLEISSSLTYSPEINLTSENRRTLSTVIFSATGVGFPVDSLKIDVPDTDLVIPQMISIGSGIGKPRKWFAGVQYTNVESKNFTNRFINVGNVSFENSSRIAAGGYFIPKYNSFTSYLSRVVYMAGIRYEETGIVINDQSIDDFGISFGLGLPVSGIQSFSNANIGFEFGQKGTTTNGLVKEKYFNIRIGLSFNDRWFVKRKYN
jgi:long-subunit fatty acid transport protein